MKNLGIFKAQRVVQRLLKGVIFSNLDLVGCRALIYNVKGFLMSICALCISFHFNCYLLTQYLYFRVAGCLHLRNFLDWYEIFQFQIFVLIYWLLRSFQAAADGREVTWKDVPGSCQISDEKRSCQEGLSAKKAFPSYVC